MTFKLGFKKVLWATKNDNIGKLVFLKVRDSVFEKTLLTQKVQIGISLSSNFSVGQIFSARIVKLLL